RERTSRGRACHRRAPAQATAPPAPPPGSNSPDAASPAVRARASPALRCAPSRGSGRTARGSRGRTGPPRSGETSAGISPGGASSTPGGRIVAAVGRELQELIRLVRPELADQWVRVHDGVGELAGDPLHLEDVYVLRRVAQVVELDRSARILDRLARLADGGQEPAAVLAAALPHLRRL